MRSLAFFKRLREMGMDEDMALRAAEAFEEEVTAAVAAVLEPRRRKDRERKRVPRNSAESADSMDSAEPPETRVSPTPPSQTQTPSSPPYSPPKKADLDEVATRIWSLQPSIDGKRRQTRPDVRRALVAVLRHAKPEEVERACGAYYALPASLKDGGQYAMGAARLLQNDRWREFVPGVAGPVVVRQIHPPFAEGCIRDAVVLAKGEAWAASWLDPCAWEAERRVIVPRTGFAAQRLRTEVTRILAAHHATIEELAA